MNRNKLFLCSLTSLAVIATSAAHAEQLVTAPTFEGGMTASIGTFYVQPSTDNLGYTTTQTGQLTDDRATTIHNVTPDYDFGIEASLGYIFEDTANGIELSYRNINTSDSDTTAVVIADRQREFPASTTFDVVGNIGFELNAFDLMISQYMDIGDNMQMRFMGGLAYVELEEQGDFTAELVDVSGNPFIDTVAIDRNLSSEFTGWGPRIGIDSRYDFGQGFGIVGGGSAAYYLGDLDYSTSTFTTFESGSPSNTSTVDNIDGHAVTNFRANLGIDYVYFFDNEDRSTIGLELGYLVDYYADAAILASATGNVGTTPTVLPYDITFSGPYLNLKGVF